MRITRHLTSADSAFATVTPPPPRMREERPLSAARDLAVKQKEKNPVLKVFSHKPT
jgi:hypothetical protein